MYRGRATSLPKTRLATREKDTDMSVRESRPYYGYCYPCNEKNVRYTAGYREINGNVQRKLREEWNRYLGEDFN